jgi:hypothetical protein
MSSSGTATCSPHLVQLTAVLVRNNWLYSSPGTATSNSHQVQQPAILTRYSHQQFQPGTATNNSHQVQPPAVLTRNSHLQSSPVTAAYILNTDTATCSPHQIMFPEVVMCRSGQLGEELNVRRVRNFPTPTVFDSAPPYSPHWDLMGFPHCSPYPR